MKLTDMSGKQLLDLFAISIYRDQKFCEAGHGKQISFDDLVGGEE